jgi:hypothetical protein
MPRNIEDYYPPSKYDYVRICVFRTHERIKNGRPIKVTVDDLQETADNHNDLWEKYARASPVSLGHTLDHGPGGGEIAEASQPDTAGVLVRFEVDKVPTEPDADFLFALWCRPKDKKEELSKYVSLSPEFYPSKHLIYPASLLKSNCPELVEMPALPLLYNLELKEGEEKPYRLTIDSPFHYSQETEVMPPFEEKKTDDKDAKTKEAPKKDSEEKAMDDAEKKESKGAKSDASKIDELMAMFQQYLPLLQELQQMMEAEGEGDDAMTPADGDEDKPKGKPVPEPEKGQEVPAEKDSMKDAGVSPVKFDASMPSGTNGFIPSATKNKDNYKMDKTDEALKYKAELDKVKAELAANKKIATDLYKESRKAKAEKWVYDLESTHNIQYKSETEKNEDIEMLSQLDEDTAKVMLERMKVRYQRKLPDAAAVKDVAKYAVESEPDFTAKTPEEAHERAMAILKSGLTVDQFYAKLKDGVKK